jgi:hypothetical protein
MTAIEKQTLQKLNDKFDIYIEADRLWKEEFKNKLDPLVEEHNDKILLQKTAKYFWRGIAGIVLFIGSVGVMVHYLPDIVNSCKSFLKLP